MTEPLLPPMQGGGRDHQQVINAIMWKLRTAAHSADTLTATNGDEATA